MKLFALIWLFSALVGANEGHGIINNDNYCDAIDGSDETNTSACSHLMTLFTCNIGRDNAHTIPTSRVNDGICDCCDGTDEFNSPFKPNCLDTCDHEIMQQKQQALAWHRTVQAGIQTKNGLVDSLKRKKRKENKSYETLKEERNELNKLVKKMNFLLNKEQVREKEMRTQLLRERESHCSSGSESACDYFYSGFHPDDEIVNEGYPLELLDPKKALQHEYTPREQEYRQKLDTVERVRWALCPVKTLLPDDDARIFVKVGEYLNFMSTPGADVRGIHHKSVTALRKHTLLGTFLEDGSRGYEQGGVFISECLGILLSPVIVSVYTMQYSYHYISQILWSYVKYISTLDSAFDPMSEFVPTFVVHFFQVIASVEVEGSRAFELMNALDYTSYSGVMAFLDTASETFKTPLWMWEIVNRVPYMMYDYYYLKQYDQLPPSRRACLLRNGIVNAMKEIDDLTAKITTEEEMRALLLKASSTTTSRSISASGSNRKGSKHSMSPSIPTVVDYGVDSVFEVLKDVCIDKTFGHYEYTFCFFNDIKQDKHTSLGAFHTWGPPVPVKASVSTSTTTSRDTKHTKRRGGKKVVSGIVETMETMWDEVTESLQTLSEMISEWSTECYDSIKRTTTHALTRFTPELHDILTPIAVEWVTNQTCSLTDCDASSMYRTSGIMSSSDAYNKIVDKHRHKNGTVMRDRVEQYYTQQFYSDGTMCQTKPGYTRRAEVQFICDVKNDIVDLTELEMCSYRLVVSTPIVCTKLMEEKSLAELERLGVFGFTKKKTG